jgi:L-ascorbate metabolism protein UlaG (beta-lactamase superfamily)
MFEVVRNVPSPTPYGRVDLGELQDPNAMGFTLWWLGNAGFAINWADRVVFIDPIIELCDESDPLMSEIGLPLRGPLPLRASQVTHADLVLLTHEDGDHTGPRTTPELIARTKATFVGTERTARQLRDYGLPEARIRVARYDEPIQLGDLTVTPTPARHQESQNHTVRGDCCGFIVRGPGLSLWHPDDTDLLEEHLTIKDIDLLLLPIAPHVLSTQGSITLAASTRARHIIPCHYGTYVSDVYWCTGDPEAVRVGVENADERYHMLAIGERFHLAV